MINNNFENHKILLWLVEFQEDKSKFSIHKLLIYTGLLMEAYPDAIVIPTVLFTDKKKWRKDVIKKLETKFNNRLFLYFEYVFIKLFNFNAIDYFNISNPVVKILLPKMNYPPEKRMEVIIEAYKGLYALASPLLFDKYVDFIDTYAEIEETERENVYKQIIKNKETFMLAQYIREKGKQEGKQEGIKEGREEGREEGVVIGSSLLLKKLIAKKYSITQEELEVILQGLKANDLLELGEFILECDSFKDVKLWIENKKSH